MTLAPEDPGRSRRDLARMLRMLRKQAGLSGDRLARRCNMSQSKISKIETGKVVPNLVDVDLLLRALETPPDLAQEITALVRTARTEWQDNRSSWRRGLEKRQSELAVVESESTELRYFLPAMITGLLATPAYVKASLAHAPIDVSATVQRKIERQQVLYSGEKSFTFVLTVQAVTWPIAPPAAMVEQIEHLAFLSRLPGVRLGVLVGENPIPRGPMNTFTIYDRRIATVETLTGRIVFHDSKDVDQHREAFDLFEENSCFGGESRELLREMAETVRSRER